jgi:hypothetical protein
MENPFITAQTETGIATRLDDRGLIPGKVSKFFTILQRSYWL